MWSPRTDLSRLAVSESSTFCKQFCHLSASSHSIRDRLKHYKAPLYLKHMINNSRKIFTEPYLSPDKTKALPTFHPVLKSVEYLLLLHILLLRLGSTGNKYPRTIHCESISNIDFAKKFPPLQFWLPLVMLINCTIKIGKTTFYFYWGEPTFHKHNS